MRNLRYLLVVIVAVAVLIMGAKLVSAQPQPQQYYGGGMIQGQVYGFDYYDELHPIVWATVYARSGPYTFTAYSGGGGWYQMYVPSGVYNVTVVEPGYKAYSNAVTVSNGSASTINLYLEESHVPVPEFPTGMASIITIAVLSAALLAVRRSKRRS